jgi:hypothetical protein
VSRLDPGRDGPVRHPEDREAPDRDGPWLAVLALATLAWLPLALVDWRLLSEGTLLWATVRSLATLVLAPLAAAALLGDVRALDADPARAAVGRVRWLYACCVLVVPPTAVVYLAHRRARRRRDGGGPGRDATATATASGTSEAATADE